MLCREGIEFSSFGKVGWHSLTVLVHEPDIKLRIRIFLRGRFLEPEHRLLIVCCGPVAFVEDQPNLELRVRETLLCGFCVPLEGFGLIRWETESKCVAGRKARLAHGESLFGGFSEPSGSLLVIFRNAPAVSVSDSHVVLRLGVPVLRAFQKPTGRLSVVAGHTQANRVERARVILRFSIAFLSSDEKPAKSFGIVSCYPETAQIRIRELELRVYVSLIRLSGDRNDVIG